MCVYSSLEWVKRAFEYCELLIVWTFDSQSIRVFLCLLWKDAVFLVSPFLRTCYRATMW